MLDVASIHSVSIVVDVFTSAVSLTDDSGCGLTAEVSQLQSMLCLKPPSASSEWFLSVFMIVSIGEVVCRVLASETRRKNGVKEHK